MRTNGMRRWWLVGLSGWMVIPAALGQTTPLVTEGVVAGPVAKVWAAFTTAEGLKSWMVPHAEFDLRIGGKMRTNYNKDGMLGDAGTIENEVLAFEPERMLTIKVAKAPERFPFKQAVQKMWTVIYFEPLAPDRTRLRVVGLGFTDDEESQQMRKHFAAGNAWTVRKLQEAFGTPATQPAEQTLTVARRLLGGTWKHASEGTDGQRLRVRNTYTEGPDGKSLIAESWMDRGAGEFCHGRLQAWREPGTGRIMFQSLGERGDVARGELRATGPDRLEWDWYVQALDGAVTHYRVDMSFTGADAYRFKLSLLDTGAWRQMFDLPFDRQPAQTEALRHAEPTR